MGCRYLRELYFNPQVKILLAWFSHHHHHHHHHHQHHHHHHHHHHYHQLHLFFQCQPPEEQIMPRVIACLLRHLPLLQVDHHHHHHWRHHYHHFCHLKRHHYVQYPYDHKVVDLANLHPGIEHYYRGTSNSKLS